MTETKSFNKNRNIYIAELLLFFVMALFFIPCMDDIHYTYEFRANSLSELIQNVINYGNGRFLGNLCGQFFAAHRVLAALFRTAVLAGITECLQRLFYKKDIRFLIFAGMIAGSVYLFSDVIAWNAAFCNYIPPILLFLICLLMLKNYDSDISSVKKAAYIVLGIVVSFCAQLFIEHNAIVNAFILFILSIYYFKKKDKRFLFSFLMLVFACAGGLVLVFAPRFMSIEPLVQAYIKTFEFNIPKLLFNIIGMFSLSAKEIAFDCAVFGFLSVLIIIALKKAELRKNIKLMLTASQFLYPVITVLTIVFYEGRKISANVETVVNIIRLGVCVIYVCGILISILLIVKDKKVKQIIMLIFCAALVSLPPAAMSDTAFYRGTFIVHLCVLIATILFVQELKKEFGFNFDKFKTAGSVAAVILLCIGIGLYASQYNIYLQKETSFKQQTESKASVVYLPELSDVLLHFPNSDPELDFRYGKNDCYNSDELPEYKYMPYKEWKEFISSYEK